MYVEENVKSQHDVWTGNTCSDFVLKSCMDLHLIPTSPDNSSMDPESKSFKLLTYVLAPDYHAVQNCDFTFTFTFWNLLKPLYTIGSLLNGT